MNLPSRQAAVVLQAKPEVVWQGSRWEIQGRPTFYSYVRPELLTGWNKDPNNKQLTKSSNLTKEQLAQCHKISWHDIKNKVVAFINGEMTEAEFIIATETIFFNDTNSECYRRMHRLRGVVVWNVKFPHKVAESIIDLCAVLNSSTANLRLGDAKVNSGIQERFDPNLEKHPNGLGMTPFSKNVLRNDISITDPRLSLNGNSIATSSLGGRFVHISEMSPQTADFLRPFTKQNQGQPRPQGISTPPSKQPPSHSKFGAPSKQMNLPNQRFQQGSATKSNQLPPIHNGTLFKTPTKVSHHPSQSNHGPSFKYGDLTMSPGNVYAGARAASPREEEKRYKLCEMKHGSLALEYLRINYSKHFVDFIRELAEHKDFQGQSKNVLKQVEYFKLQNCAHYHGFGMWEFGKFFSDKNIA
jgi:hypothetical protein